MSPPITYLFLDFDGVLNSSQFFTARVAAKLPIRNADERVDPVNVARLNRIVEAVDPIIVASTTWRHNFSSGALTMCLRSHGFIGQIRGSTPLHGHAERGGEIQAYMDHRGATASQIVILDDNDDMDHLYPRLVRTSDRDGLTDRDVDRAISMLRAAPR